MKQATAVIVQALWLPHLDRFEAVHVIEGAPWVPQESVQQPAPPHLRALHERHAARHAPIHVTDGTTEVHLRPVLTALRINHRTDGSAYLVVNVGWFDEAERCVHGIQYVEDLEGEDAEVHAAWRTREAATRHVSIAQPAPPVT